MFLLGLGVGIKWRPEDLILNGSFLFKLKFQTVSVLCLFTAMENSVYSQMFYGDSQDTR